jgi:hypothetical protein
VEMHLPDTVAQATTLATVQEHLNEKYKHSTRKSYVVKSDTKSGGVPPGLWKARQLKEFRRANNLCFKCGEKYGPTHTCKTPEGTLHMMDQSTFDGGGFLSDEVLNTLEQSHLHLLQDDCYLSLHALSGAPQHRAIQLRALIRNQVLVILVDSGSSHTFLNSVLADKLQVAVSPLPPMSVKVANGVSLSCSGEVKGFEWWVQGHTFNMDTKIIDMGAYDLVLGMDWLEQFSPMTCNWLDKWIEFQYKKKTIRLQGMVSSPLPQQL